MNIKVVADVPVEGMSGANLSARSVDRSLFGGQDPRRRVCATSASVHALETGGDPVTRALNNLRHPSLVRTQMLRLRVG
jgi:hypothetical protein